MKAAQFLGAACVAFMLAPSCRKAEPEEIVNAPVANGGSSGQGGSQSGGTSGASGTGGSFNSDASSDAGAGGTGGSVNAQCLIPEIPTTGDFSKKALLESAASCAMGHYCRFLSRATELRDRAQALLANPTPDTHAAARQAWTAAIDSWQRAELFRFGPAAIKNYPGGQDLRSFIYSWPAAGRCKIDEQTVNRFYQSANFTGPANVSLVNARTLSTLEYLLFYSGTDNGCHQFSAINASGSWAALGGAELELRKAEYAAAAAEDLLNSATKLVRAWEPDGGNFRQAFVTAGEGSSVYPNQQAALNALNFALFYIEEDVKDLKIGAPIGKRPECGTPPCLESIESKYARRTTDNIRANLAGFRSLFQGCAEGNAGFGFDDLLRATGSGDLADRMLAALDKADATASALNPPLEQAVVTNIDRVEGLYKAVQDLTTLLKSEFVSVLNLERPAESIGDND